MRPLVLLDRDGTINVEKHYLSSPDQVELLDGAAEGIQLLRSLGLPTVVVTNQSAIARRYFAFATLERIHYRLNELLAARGAYLDAMYVCPHHPVARCHCRKPAPGLARKAAEEFGGDLSRSFVVGDQESDIAFGKCIGATTLLVRTGYGHRVVSAGAAQPDYIVDGLLEAAHVIQRRVGTVSVQVKP